MDPGAANPYLPPRADLGPAPSPDDAGAPLATRWQRLLGVVVDGLIYYLASSIISLGPGEVVTGRFSDILKYTRSGLWGYAAGGAVLAVVGLQWYLVSKRGQTLGKMVVRSRIVRLDGRPVDFLHGIVLRNWILGAPVLLVASLGLSARTTVALGQLVMVLWAVDGLLILGLARRCLHDRLANTKVIDLAPYVDPPPPAAAPSS